MLSGFELENLAAGIAANAKGLPGAAAGTFLGGTTFLALGVAGLAALIAPIDGALPRPVLAWTTASPLALVVLSLDGELSRVDGMALPVWFAVVLFALVAGVRELLDEGTPSRKRWPFVRLAGGLGLLTAGGEVLGEGVRGAVDRFGFSQTLLGNTVVAASVEAEEIARVVVPARRGRGELALGNIAGTVAHFTAFNAGAIALVKPLALDEATLRLHLPVAAGATIVFCVLVSARGGLSRFDGALLVGAYATYLVAAIVVG